MAPTAVSSGAERRPRAGIDQMVVVVRFGVGSISHRLHLHFGATVAVGCAAVIAVIGCGRTGLSASACGGGLWGAHRDRLFRLLRRIEGIGERDHFGAVLL